MNEMRPLKDLMIESFDAASAIMVTRATGYPFNTPNRIRSVQINCLRRLLKLLLHDKFTANRLNAQ